MRRKIAIAAMVIIIVGTAFLISGCTLSFQNIDTHGTATDLIDENLSTAPSANIPVTVKGV